MTPDPIGLVIAAVRIYMLVIFVRAMFSWLPPRHRQNELYAFVFAITEPVIRPVRKILPPMGGMDFSPLAVLVLLQVLSHVLIRSVG